LQINFKPEEFRELEVVFQRYLDAVKLVVSIRGYNPAAVGLAPDRKGFLVADDPPKPSSEPQA
jgi:hypothetical protein